MKLRYAALIASFILAVGQTFAQQWTLDQCIEYAIAHNIDIQQKALLIKQQDIDLNTSRNGWLPEVNANVAEQFSSGNYNATTGTMDGTKSEASRNLAYTTGSISAAINVFDGFKVKNSIKADKFSLDAATADLERARKDIGIQVATYYLQCLYYKNMVSVARAQVDVSKEMLKRATVLVDEGKRPLSDKKDLEATVASDEYSLADAEGQFTLSLLSLAQLLNLPMNNNFDVAEVPETTMLEQNADAIYENIVEQWPAITSAKSRIDENRARVEIARSAYYPTLSLQAGIHTFYVNMFHQNMGWGGFGDQFFDNNLNEVIGLHLNVPIFNRFETRNNIRKAKLKVVSSELNLEDSRLNLRKEIETAYTNYHVAKNKLAFVEKAVDAAAISVAYEKDRYDAGKGSIFDVQQAQQKLLKAQQDAVQTKFEYLIRQRILDFYKK